MEGLVDPIMLYPSLLHVHALTGFPLTIAHCIVQIAIVLRSDLGSKEKAQTFTTGELFALALELFALVLVLHTYQPSWIIQGFEV